jgi:hypothetical protein
VLIVAVTVSSLQMCSKETYDIHVMYAGSRNVLKTSQNGDLTEYQKMLSSLKYAAGDYDGDGDISVSLDVLYMLSEKEIEEINAQLKEENEKNNTDYSLNMSQLNENNTVFRERLMYSEYYVCFISKPLYETYREINGVQMFMPLAGYVDAGRELTYLDECAVYLNSTGFGKLPMMSELPEDTVVVLRTLSAIASHYDKRENEQHFKNSEEMLRSILNYGE